MTYHIISLEHLSSNKVLIAIKNDALINASLLKNTYHIDNYFTNEYVSIVNSISNYPALLEICSEHKRNKDSSLNIYRYKLNCHVYSSFKAAVEKNHFVKSFHKLNF